MALLGSEINNSLKEEIKSTGFEEIVVKQEKNENFIAEPLVPENICNEISEKVLIKEEIPSDDDGEPSVEVVLASNKPSGPVKGETNSEDSDLSQSGHNLSDEDEGEEQESPEKLEIPTFTDGGDEKPYACRVCGESFMTFRNLHSHMKKPARDRTFACCACNKTFRDMTQLNVHTRKHTGDKPYECKICAKKFSINGNLNKHMRIHTGEKRFSCEVCERKFSQFAHLEDHMQTHSAERPFICDQCDSGFKTKARLRKHIKSHDKEIRKKNIPCQICFRTFWSSKQLMIHMSRHTNSEYPFQCIVCDKKFKEYSNYQNHLRTHKQHPGIRAYKCHLCGKAFASSSHLRRHVNSHAGLKPYLCDLCMRAFPCAQNLKRHMKTHTGEKPHVCETCQKAFLTIENLNRHIRIHTGEKPFPCPTCGKRFAHSTTVKEHLRLHTGEKPYGCSICDRRFGMNKLLYRHIRTRHPEHAGFIIKNENHHPIQFVDIKKEPSDGS